MELFAAKSGGLRNLLRGATFTATLWDTPPSDLANITDGDMTTTSGTGSKATSGAGTVGYLTYDLGSNKVFLFGGYVTLTASAGNAQVYIDVGLTDSDLPNKGGSSVTCTSSSAVTYHLDPGLYFGRYIRVRVYASAAATVTAAFKSLVAYELGW